MSREELKPCPFCGSEAKIEGYSPLEGYYLYNVGCNQCEFSPFTMDYSKKQEAITAWNTRKEGE